MTPRPHPRRGGRAVLVAVPLALGTAVGGCGTGHASADPARPTTATAVDACLRAAVDHLGFPLEESPATTVSVERDAQGWWAVRATAGDGDAARTLTCTAVPDAEAGARAASFALVDAG